MEFEPEKITRDHIEKAVQKIKGEGIDIHSSTGYDVIIDGETFPPKEIMRYGHEQMNGERIWERSGGEPTNKYLENLGFEIVMKTENYTWVKTHKEIAKKLKGYRDSQRELIDVLDQSGVEENTLMDEDINGQRVILSEIDPYSFFCFINKYGNERRLQILQRIAKYFEVSHPNDTNGIPTANGQKVMMFPFVSGGRTNDVDQLWDLFEKELNDEITNDDFLRIISIKSVGPTKFTEALFSIAPEKYLPINAQTKPYLKNIFEIDPNFESFNEYLKILEEVRRKTEKPFYQISHEAWEWNTKEKISELNKTSGGKTMIENQRNSLNQILFGPPGTGKTYHTVNRALQIVEPEFYKHNKNDRQKLTDRFRELLFEDRKEMPKNWRIAFTTFHQSFTYEDFVEGIKPVLEDDEEVSHNIQYKIIDGIFKRICEKARYAKTEKEGVTKEMVSLSETDFKNSQFYKVSLGNSNNEEDNVIYDYCKDHGKIAIGHLGHLDLTGKDESDFRELIKKDSELSSGAVQMMNYFVNYLKKDDYIIVSNGNKHARAVGRVTGEYEYNPETQIRYPHFRDVDWLLTDKEIPVDEIYGKDFQMQPIYMLKKDWLNPDFFKSKEVKQDINEQGVTPDNYVLIIDEINRGNISEIFGELITLIEEDKREGEKENLSVVLPYSKKVFSVPANVYIIGTMNTADRSIEALDTALRRRFKFEEMPPQLKVIEEEGALKESKSELRVGDEYYKLTDILKTLNMRIKKLLDKDHLIGHSYFMDVDSTEDLQHVFYRNIIPLLEEYFYGDKGKIQLVLGEGFIQKSKHTGETDLFAVSEYDDTIFEDRVIWELTTDWRFNENDFEKALVMLLNKKA